MTASKISGSAGSAGVAAWAHILRVHAAVLPELDRRLQRQHGLPLTWYDVLLELNGAAEARLTRTELSRRVVVSASRLSRVVDELVVAGLVEREPNPDDGRSSLVRLTAPGKRRFYEAAPSYLADIDALFGQHLEDGDAEAIVAALGRVLRHRQEDDAG